MGHRKVLSSITRCRTGQLGSVHYRCDGCGYDHWVGRSCGNRHCPACGHDKTYRWLQKQADRLMPVHHFLVTFTVPKEGAARVAKGWLPQSLQGGGPVDSRCGFGYQELARLSVRILGVLHTWGRDPMIYHPHVHCVVPGGGVKLDEAGEVVGWQATPENFLFHHGTLVIVYRAKLADELRQCGLYEHVAAETWSKKFVVDIQPVGDGKAVLKYLAPYVHRVAISDRRIVNCDQASVTYRYTPSKSRTALTRTVDGHEFVRGFAQHVLPRGFQKVRHYGWMSSHAKVSVEQVRWLVWLLLGWTYWLASGHAPTEILHEPRDVRCARCGCSMRVVHISFESLGALSDHALAYLDSG